MPAVASRSSTPRRRSNRRPTTPRPRHSEWSPYVPARPPQPRGLLADESWQSDAHRVSLRDMGVDARDKGPAWWHRFLLSNRGRRWACQWSASDWLDAIEKEMAEQYHGCDPPWFGIITFEQWLAVLSIPPETGSTASLLGMTETTTSLLGLSMGDNEDSPSEGDDESEGEPEHAR